MIIAKHCLSRDWQPKLPWPDDCSVQWGSKGVVFSREGNYSTAFFEAFPKDNSGGFIRGEGESVSLAEKDAFEKYKSEIHCAHVWSRTLRLKNGGFSTYTNGGCFCLKCNAFKTVMRPIVKLGSWGDYLSASDFSLINMGVVSPFCESKKYARRLFLKGRMFGIELPDWQDFNGLDSDECILDSFNKACRHAVKNYIEEIKQFLAHSDLLNAEEKGMESSYTHSLLHVRAVNNGYQPSRRRSPPMRNNHEHYS